MKNMILSLVSTIAMQFFNFMSGVMIARILGAADRGELAHIISWFSFLVPLALLGVNDGVTYYTSLPGRDLPRIVSTSVLAAVPTIILGAIASGIMFTTVFSQASSSVVAACLIFAAYIPIYQLTQILLSIFQGTQSMKIWNIARFLVSPLYVALIVAAWLLGAGSLVGITIANIGAALIVLLFLVASGIRRWSPGRPDAKLFANIFRFGRYTLFQRAMIVSRDNLDRMVLPLFVSMADLGHYAVSAAVAYFIFLIGYTVDMVAFPAISSISDPVRKVANAELLLRAGIYLTLGGTVVIGLMIYPLIVYAFGSEFRASVEPAFVLLAAGMMQSIKMCLASSFKAFNRAKVLAFVDFGSVLGMIVLLFTLPAKFGIFGACLAQLLPAVGSVAMLVFYITPVLGIRRSTLIRPTMADVTMLKQLLVRKKVEV